MESLNMSKLNLSSVRSSTSNESSSRVDSYEAKIENALTDPDDEYHCEYRDEIWQNLLEQEGQKPIIHLQSPQLEFRGTLVQQLRDVTKKLGLSIATLHSAVAQLDLFMDAHRLRADRLTHVALACLSLAAKSEEKFSRAPTLKTLAKISGVNLCGKTFRQLEWMVGQHVRWRLLAPTPVTFAALLAQYVVTDADLTTRHPKFVRRFKRDGAKLLDSYLDLTLSAMISGVNLCGKTFRQLEWMVGQHVRWRLLAPTPVTFAALLAQYVVTDADLTTRHPKFVRRFKRDGAKLLDSYLDLTLSDVRLKVVESVDVGCACVACARAELGLAAWPPWLQRAARRTPAQVAPIARLLQRMMQILKNRESGTESEADQGYSSARTSPNLTPCTSPRFHVSPVTAEAGPAALDMTLQRVHSHDDYRYCRSRRLLEASLEPVPSTSMGVKRSLESNVELDRKRYRLTTQMSQVVL